MEEQKRGFTGLWIPAHIIEDERLSKTDIILYAEIASFGNACFTSNAHLGKRWRLTERSIITSITKLKKLGYVKQTSFDGRRRYLKAIYDMPEQGGKKTQVRPAENFTSNLQKTSPIDISIDNSIDIPETSSDSANQDNFNFPLKVNDWLTGKDEAYRLIAQMFLYKGLTFGSSAQMQSAARRHLRAARLIVPFTQEQRDEAFTRMLQNKSLGNEWTLDTLYKYLTK